MLKVLNTEDNKVVAYAQAQMYGQGNRRVGVMEVRQWNAMFPTKLLRTANRYVVFEEIADTE